MAKIITPTNDTLINKPLNTSTPPRDLYSKDSEPPTIYRFEDLEGTIPRTLNHKHYIKNFLFNSVGHFYEVSKDSDYYVYFFKIDEYVKKIQIEKNSTNISKGLSSKVKEFPIAGFFYTEKDLPLSNNPEIDIASIGFTPGTTRIEVSNIGLHYLPFEFDSISNYDPDHEYKMPNNIFNIDYTSKTLYVAVVSKCAPEEAESELTISTKNIERDTLLFIENPIAEAIYDGDSLFRSRIKFGSITQNGEKIGGGLCLWNKDPRDCIKKDKNKDYLEFEAVCYTIKFEQTMERNFSYEAFIVNDLDYFFKPTFNISKYNSLISYVRSHYNTIGKFKAQVPVFKKTENNKDVFIWYQNGLLKTNEYYKNIFNSDLLENAPQNLKKCNRHSKYPNLFDSFSLQEIYPETEYFETVSPREAADKIARALLAQPKGRRSISVEGSAFERLAGGAIQLADEIRYEKDAVEKPKDNDPEKLQAYNEYIEELVKIKKKKNFLCSMVYFDDSPESWLCGDGYIFYDAPIHYDNPRIKDVDDSTKEDFCERLRKLYTNKYVRSDDNPDGPISGCEALKNLLDKIFKELKYKYHIDVDYIYCDFEGMRNTANEIRVSQRGLYISEDADSSDPLYATRDQVWKSILESLQFRQDKESDEYQKIFKHLQERGYAFKDQEGNDVFLNDVKSCRHSTTGEGINSAKSSNGYNNIATSYATRRNVNIWDCVMMEYYAGWLEKYLVAPIRYYYQNAICSLHSLNNQAGYINHHQNGSDFESYLGGSVNLPAGIRSNPSLYTLKLDTFEKDSMDNWKTYIPKITPFARLKFYVNNVRAATQSNIKEKVHPFIATQYSWNNYSCNRTKKVDPEDFTLTREQLQTVYDNSYFQREMLIHSWMCKPEITYAYLDYNYDTKRGDKVLKVQPQNNIALFESIDKQDYFNEVLVDIQKTIKELDNRLPPSKKAASLIQNIVPENSPFILSGWKIGKYQIYRITLEDFGPDSFKNIRYLRRQKKGIFFTGFSRLRKSNRKSKQLTAYADGKVIVFPSGCILKHEKGPGRWIVMKGNNRPYVLTKRDYFESNPSLYMKGNDLPVFRQGHSVSVLDNTSIFGDIAHNQKWEAMVKFKELNSETVVFGEKLGERYKQYKINNEYKFTKEFDFNKEFIDNDNIRPMNYLDIVKGNNEASEFKAIIQGANVRVDLYREDDGINIGRVTKDITNEKFKETECGDKIILKLSWLNATNCDATYIVEYKIDDSISFSQKIKCDFGDEGYKLFRVGTIPKGTKKISAIVRLRNGLKELHKAVTYIH